MVKRLKQMRSSSEERREIGAPVTATLFREH